jgi:hypothetical protein
MEETEFSIDRIKQLWIEQNHRIAAQINSLSLGNFLQAARNWATQVGTQGKATMPKPVAPSAVEAAMEFEPNWSCSFPETGVPVSTVDPSSLLPTFPTDTNAIGGPIGGPIPDQPGKFYMASTDDRKLWYYSKGGRNFARVQVTPFQMYWYELT